MSVRLFLIVIKNIKTFENEIRSDLERFKKTRHGYIK
jgi:hypothetical protein